MLWAESERSKREGKAIGAWCLVRRTGAYLKISMLDRSELGRKRKRERERCFSDLRTISLSLSPIGMVYNNFHGKYGLIGNW